MRDRFREEVARLIWMDGSNNDTGWKTSYTFVHKVGLPYIIANQILSIKVDNCTLEVVDWKAELPKNQYKSKVIRKMGEDVDTKVTELMGYIENKGDRETAMHWAYNMAQQDILKANFRKVIKEE